MITFDLASLKTVKTAFASAALAFAEMIKVDGIVGSYTAVPSLQVAMTQHQSFLNGQTGSLHNVKKFIRNDVFWLGSMLDNHISAFGLQERMSAQSFSQMNSTVEFGDEFFKIRDANREQYSIDNLLYVTPVTAVEATTPLQALIGMFQGNDALPLNAAKQWTDAGNRLIGAMNSLREASQGLSSAAQGYSFDQARLAIDAVVNTGTIVGNNAVLMGTTMSEFPGVRIANLNALHAIQASTSLITEPVARISAEQGAVATFVSTQLQPSLELLKPPVANLGVPVVGHTGGGLLEVSSTSSASAPTTFHTPAGASMQTSPAATSHLGGQAQQAMQALPNASGATQLASAPATAVAPPSGAVPPAPSGGINSAATTPSAVNPAEIGIARPRGAGEGSRGIQAAPNGLRGSQPVNSPEGLHRGVGSGAGGVGNGRGGRATAGPRNGTGPVVPQLPRSAHNHLVSKSPLLGNGTDAVGGKSGPGHPQGATSPLGERAAKNGTHNGAPKSNQLGAHGTGATKGGVYGMGGAHSYGNAGKRDAARRPNATSTGKTSTGVKKTNSGGVFGRNESIVRRHASTAAGLTGNGKWAPQVNEYFRRQYLGTSARTVKAIIRQGRG